MRGAGVGGGRRLALGLGLAAIVGGTPCGADGPPPAATTADAPIEAASDPPPAAPLLTIAEVQALPRGTTSAGGSVRVRGVVTLADLRPAIQDGARGLHLTGGGPESWASAESEHAAAPNRPFTVGDEVEIEGAIVWSGFAPRIAPREIRVLGRKPLPQAEPADLVRLFGGGDNARRLALTGIVQGWRDEGPCWRLLFSCESRSIAVELPKTRFPDPPEPLVDADVQVAGVVRSIFNTRGEFVAPAVQVARGEDLTVLVPPSAPPFGSTEVPLEAIGTFRQRPFLGHRFRTRGTVSFIVPGTLFLQEGKGGVRVDLAGGRDRPSPLEPGDVVEVAGFLSMSRQVGGIIEAEARRIGSGPPPEPLAVDVAEIVGSNLRHRARATVAPEGSYDGCLVRCLARLEGIDTVGPGIALALDSAGTIFNATLYEPLPPTPDDPVAADRQRGGRDGDRGDRPRARRRGRRAGGKPDPPPRGHHPPQPGRRDAAAAAPLVDAGSARRRRRRPGGPGSRGGNLGAAVAPRGGPADGTRRGRGDRPPRGGPGV